MSYRLTPVQEQLLVEIQQRGGYVRSLRWLTGELGINYPHAYDCVSRLEQSGYLTVLRRRGYPMEIKRVTAENTTALAIFPESGSRKQRGQQ